MQYCIPSAVSALAHSCVAVYRKLWSELNARVDYSRNIKSNNGRRCPLSHVQLSYCKTVHANTLSTLLTPTMYPETPLTLLCTNAGDLHAHAQIQTDMIAFRIARVVSELQWICSIPEERPDRAFPQHSQQQWFVDLYLVILLDEETLVMCLVLAKRCAESGLVCNSAHFIDLCLGCALLAAKLHHDRDFSLFSIAWALDITYDRLDQAEAVVFEILLQRAGDGLFVRRDTFERELCALRGCIT